MRRPARRTDLYRHRSRQPPWPPRNWLLERFCETARALLAARRDAGLPAGAAGRRCRGPHPRVLRRAHWCCAPTLRPPPGASLDLLIAEGQRFAALVRQLQQRRRPPAGHRRRPGRQPLRPHRPRPLGAGRPGQHDPAGARLWRRDGDPGDPRSAGGGRGDSGR